MVTETYVSTLNINLNQQWTPPTTQTEHQQRHMPIPPAPATLKTNAPTIQEKTCSCGRRQEYKYPCRHAMAYFWKWQDVSFPDILQDHVHDYYWNKSMQQIYGYNIFPVVQDQIRYDGETNPPTLGMQQPGLPKTKQICNHSWFLDPDEFPIKCLSVEREDIIEGHAQML